jgi:hypothetical protein
MPEVRRRIDHVDMIDSLQTSKRRAFAERISTSPLKGAGVSPTDERRRLFALEWADASQQILDDVARGVVRAIAQEFANVQQRVAAGDNW